MMCLCLSTYQASSKLNEGETQNDSSSFNSHVTPQMCSFGNENMIVMYGWAGESTQSSVEW